MRPNWQDTDTDWPYLKSKDTKLTIWHDTEKPNDLAISDDPERDDMNITFSSPKLAKKAAEILMRLKNQ